MARAPRAPSRLPGLALKACVLSALAVGAWAAYRWTAPSGEEYKIQNLSPWKGASRAAGRQGGFFQRVTLDRDAGAPVDAPASIPAAAPAVSGAAPARLNIVEPSMPEAPAQTQALQLIRQEGGAQRAAAYPAGSAPSASQSAGAEAPPGEAEPKRPYRVYGNMTRDKIMSGPVGQVRNVSGGSRPRSAERAAGGSARAFIGTESGSKPTAQAADAPAAPAQETIQDVTAGRAREAADLALRQGQAILSGVMQSKPGPAAAKAALKGVQSQLEDARSSVSRTK